MCLPSLAALHPNFSITHVRSVRFQIETLNIFRRGFRSKTTSILVISRCFFSKRTRSTTVLLTSSFVFHPSRDVCSLASLWSALFWIKRSHYGEDWLRIAMIRKLSTINMTSYYPRERWKYLLSVVLFKAPPPSLHNEQYCGGKKTISWEIRNSLSILMISIASWRPNLALVTFYRQYCTFKG